MPDWNSFSFAYGPAVAIGLIAILAILLRWAFGRGASVVASPPKSGRQDEYGLLVAVAAPPTYVEAELQRRRLEDEGVRANVATTLDGPRIMVWPKDAERARALLLT